MEETSRLPEGMEWLIEAWPRFEDGDPVRFLDDFERYGDESCISAVTMYQDGSFALNFRAYSKGERVNRPAPKVLDADGVEIRVGDVLYRKSDGHMVKVAEVYEKTFIDADDYVRPGDGFTHRAPVLAADGEPLEVGQTVWEVDGTGHAFEVVGIRPDTGRAMEPTVVTCDVGDGTSEHFLTSQLTHQRPVLDAEWNRIEPAMDVWWVCEGDARRIHAEKLHVESIGDDGLVTCSPFNCGTWVEAEPSTLYVHKPVLDADGVETFKGGPGYDRRAVLPFPDADRIMPDYDLFGCEYAIGRITRGCPNRCPWCIVPGMDGNEVHRVARLTDFWCGQDTVRLLDDNIMADEDIFVDACRELHDARIKVINGIEGRRLMMISDNERREVARMLRHARTAQEIGQAVGVNCHDGLCNGCASETAQLLADLIEPEPERTCRDTDYDTKSITCSECGEITRDTLFWVDVDGGKTVKGHRPRFCSNCGAKVVGE